MGVDGYYPDAPLGSPRVGIGENSVIENAIIDKNARIGRDVRIVNADGVDEAVDEQGPLAALQRHQVLGPLGEAHAHARR